MNEFINKLWEPMARSVVIPSLLTSTSLVLLGSAASAVPGLNGSVDATATNAVAEAGRMDEGPIHASITNPFAGFNGDDVGTLPILDGGWNEGEWVLEDKFGLSEHPGLLGEDTPLDTPTLTVVGTDVALDSALKSAKGDGFIVREVLGHGLVRLSFHGDVSVQLAQAWVASGAVDVQFLIPADFAPGRAAVNWMSRWTSPISLAPGQEIAVPARIFHQGLLSRAGTLEFQALSALGEGYRATLAETTEALVLTQTQVSAQ